MKLKPILLSLSVLIMSFLVGYFIFAWQEPSLSPPEGNVPTPINIGTEPQAKAGRISATEFYDYNNPSYFLNPEGNSLFGGMIESPTFRYTPSATPTSPVEGQFYWDIGTHRPCYYTGSEWICLGEAEAPPGVCANWPTQTDDPRCEVVDCDGKDSYYDDGPDSPSGTNYCVFVDYQDITTDRCKGVGQCKTSDDCTNPTETRVDTCGLCRYCNGSSCATYGNGTSCATCKQCSGGSCNNITTDWGAGGSGCSGSNQRCYSGCKTCGGYFAAGSSSSLCWYIGSISTFDSCQNVCSGYGGNYYSDCHENDATDCRIAKHFGSCYDYCAARGNTDAPRALYQYGQCWYRTGGSSCTAASASAGYQPICACNY